MCRNEQDFLYPSWNYRSMAIEFRYEWQPIFFFFLVKISIEKRRNIGFLQKQLTKYLFGSDFN
jgi:hypothetical protein